jgi:hypothetical protein
MNQISNDRERSPADIIFFVLCFVAILTIATGIITKMPWCAALGILMFAVGLAYFAICEFL